MVWEGGGRLFVCVLLGFFGLGGGGDMCFGFLFFMLLKF